MSGPGIFRFPNLAHVRAGMHAAGYRFLEDLSADERTPQPTAAPGHEQLSLTRAALNSAVRARDGIFRSAGYPPTVFVSYRWESTEIKEFAARLARHVEARGFAVFLDQDVAALRDNDPIELGQYLSVIVDCQVVICIVTPQYLAGLEPRAWLTEERQLMNLLAGRGAMIVHLLCDGAPPPGPVRNALSDPLDPGRGVTAEVLVPDQQAFVVDMRGNRDDGFASLDRLLRYTGPRLPAGVEPSFRPWLDRVAQAHETGADGVAAAEFRLGGAFAHTVEYRRLAAHLAVRRGARDEARRLACSAATDDNASTETLIDAALLLRELGKPDAALNALARVPWWLARDWSWRVHFVQGDMLDDLASHVAALAHLKYAVALCKRSWIEKKPTTTDVAHLRGTLGYVLLFRFADPAQAHSHLAAAWQDNPTAGNSVNLIVCHAALGDWASAERVWTAAVDTIADSTDERFTGLRAALTARTIGPPQPTVRRPRGAHSWSCPTCSACLLMDDTDLLCAGCGTAFTRATWCPCCAGNQLAGAGAGTASGLVPPKCPICNTGVQMRRARG